MAHSQGPWTLGRNDATMIFCGLDNARLISAAPDLLAACKAALQVMDLATAAGFETNREAYFACRNAIAKAKAKAK